jgi:copper(I)-binding protein
MTSTRVLLVAAALALAATSAQAQSKPTVTAAWTRPTAAGMNGAGFMVVSNKGKAADVLVGGDSPAAGRVEIHQSMNHNGVMMMMKSERIALPAGGQVLFGPGGYHLMLVGLKQPLKVGDSAPITLNFASGAKVQTTLKVAVNAP